MKYLLAILLLATCAFGQLYTSTGGVIAQGDPGTTAGWSDDNVLVFTTTRDDGSESMGYFDLTPTGLFTYSMSGYFIHYDGHMIECTGNLRWIPGMPFPFGTNKIEFTLNCPHPYQTGYSLSEV